MRRFNDVFNLAGQCHVRLFRHVLSFYRWQ
jgi:hypothetical protein